MFYAIATLLNERTWQFILDSLPEGHTLNNGGKIETKFPHFSWLVGKGLDRSAVDKRLKRIAATWKGFPVFSGGFGIFPGEEPVVTINLARSKDLCELQQLIWTECGQYLSDVNMNYSPLKWIPHITLLHHGISSEEYCRFFENNMAKDICFDFKVENICVLYRDNDIVGQKDYYSLETA